MPIRVSYVFKCSTTISLAVANISTSIKVSGVCLQSIFTNSIPMTKFRAEAKKELKLWGVIEDREPPNREITRSHIKYKITPITIMEIRISK